jgi:pimeloyl-ACP methyl ester carboxylesterase
VIVGTPAELEGVLELDGASIHFQSFGDGDETLLLLPTWSIVHSDFWRRQVSYFARSRRVVVFDGRGNGASSRPDSADCYSDDAFAQDALAVLDHLNIERADLAAVSAGAGWQLILAAEHPERVTSATFIGASLPLGQALPERAEALRHFDDPQERYDGWLKFNRCYWLADWPGFLAFFFSQCFTEPGSEDEIAHFVGMGLETTPETILLTAEAPGLDRERAIELARAVRCPTLVIHGRRDAISSITRSEELAELIPGARLITMPEAGHEPQCRWPAEVNATLESFFASR